MESQKSCLCKILVQINQKGSVTETELACLVARLFSGECDKREIGQIIIGLIEECDGKYVLNAEGRSKLKQC